MGQAEGVPEPFEGEGAGEGARSAASRWNGVCLSAHLVGPMEGVPSTLPSLQGRRHQLSRVAELRLTTTE